MGFNDDVLRHAEQIKTRVSHIRGEEATKHSLVVPFLQVLGYDVFDPREIQPEYVADFAKKKAGQFEKIDYAIWLNDAPQIFIECKPLGAELADHEGQLARYFNATPSVRVAVLTNGVHWKVFGDLQQPNIMDPRPWLDVDLSAPKPSEIEALKRFRKADFSGDEIVSLAEEMVYFNAIVSFISTQLREPSDSFVRYVANEISAAERVTQKVVERLTPILRKAVQASILEHVARSFDRPATPESTQDMPREVAAPKVVERAASSNPPSSVSEATIENKAGVVTTADELLCWREVSGWVNEVHHGAALGYRDSKTYFAVHQASVRKWFLRLNVTKPPFWFAFRHLKAEELRRLAPGLEVSEGGQFGDSRVQLKALADLSKLRTAVLAAYDLEAVRVTTDDGSSTPDEPAVAGPVAER